MCTTAAPARPLPAGQSERAGGIPQAAHGGPQQAECGPDFGGGRRRRGRKEGRKGGREGGWKKLKGRKEEGGRIQKSFNLEGEVETVVSSEYFGCAHISTWFCVLRFHTRMVASRDPLRMVGPQG